MNIARVYRIAESMPDNMPVQAALAKYNAALKLADLGIDNYWSTLIAQTDLHAEVLRATR